MSMADTHAALCAYVERALDARIEASTDSRPHAQPDSGPDVRPGSPLASRLGSDLDSESSGAVFSDAARREAARAFAEQGLALERNEAWRFTDLRAFAGLAQAEAISGAPAEGAASKETRAEATALPEWLDVQTWAQAARFVFVDGRFAPGLSSSGSLPAGVQLGRLAESGDARLPLGSLADQKRRALTALNGALAMDGAYLRLDDGIVLRDPVFLIHVSSSRMGVSCPRSWIELGSNAEAKLVEIHVGSAAGARLVNAVGELRLGSGAHLEHILVQEHGPDTVHCAEIAATQERDSRLGSHSLALGGALSRTEIRTRLDGPGAHTSLHGLYLGQRNQVHDHFTTIDHAAPHTTSEELYKGILGDRSKGIFCGRVEVRPDAQKIDAQQTNRALLMSDSAAVHTRPQLEIYADDVRCSHGASIGQLDADALFYLRARGVGEEEARALLMRAFVADVLDEIAIPELQERLRDRMLAMHPEV